MSYVDVGAQTLGTFPGTLLGNLARSWVGRGAMTTSHIYEIVYCAPVTALLRILHELTFKSV